MAQILAFKGILYNKKRVNISDVVSPPYDVIPKSIEAKLRKRSKFNMVNLILPKAVGKKSKYNIASAYFEDWIKKGILKQDNTASIYVYTQDYRYMNKDCTRIGFLSLVRLEEFSGRLVLPHENTFSGPKEDRFKLLEATCANLSPIFSLFSDQDKAVHSILRKSLEARPIIDIRFNGTRERLWRVKDTRVINKLIRYMKDKIILIADGHHRYEAALNFKNHMKNIDARYSDSKSYNFVMMYFTSLEDEGLTIMPTHRVINIKFSLDELLDTLSAFFELKAYNNIKMLLADIGNVKKREHRFGMYVGANRSYLLKLKNEAILDKIVFNAESIVYRNLDVTILHSLVLDRLLKLKGRSEDMIFYTRDANEAKKLVDDKKFNLAFFLNPPKIEEVRDIALTAMRMPHKSTYFYPKVLSGLVINKLDF